LGSGIGPGTIVNLRGRIYRGITLDIGKAVNRGGRICPGRVIDPGIRVCPGRAVVQGFRLFLNLARLLIRRILRYVQGIADFAAGCPPLGGPQGDYKAPYIRVVGHRIDKKGRNQVVLAYQGTGVQGGIINQDINLIGSGGGKHRIQLPAGIKDREDNHDNKRRHGLSGKHSQ
jgi:hypothetical protein